jgi:hypothetical protein
MARMDAERAYMGRSRAKIWTYLILAVVLVIGAVVANAAFSNPEMAKHGVKSFLGLPGWALALVTFVAGAGFYWMGLKVETDWPEFLGAFLIATSVAALEFIVGWSHFELGLVVLPYLLPIAVFVILLMVGIKRSV